LVQDVSQIEAAFSVYDAIRRPRAQRIVQTSHEAGELCAMRIPGIGSDLHKIAQNQRERYLWIWLHDLLGDVAKAESDFKALVGASPPPRDPSFTGTNAPALVT
jgi:salicylate hydroxylase